MRDVIIAGTVDSDIIFSLPATGEGLVSYNGQPLTGFSIAGADGKFVAAEAVIKNNKVSVSAAAVPQPVAVKFNWNEADRPNLYNKNGLPAFPFRTNNPLKPLFK